MVGNTPLLRLRDEQPDVALVAVQPAGPYHALEGVKHMATTWKG
jgi:cysteine synthase B